MLYFWMHVSKLKLRNMAVHLASLVRVDVEINEASSIAHYFIVLTRASVSFLCPKYHRDNKYTVKNMCNLLPKEVAEKTFW